MEDRATHHAARLLLLAPIIFVCHFLEESPGFVQWFNGHVARGITQGLFWRVNLTGLAITLIVVAAGWFSRSAFSLTLAAVWLCFLMPANAIFHLAGALVDRQYVPGLATALLLYLPFYIWFFIKVVKVRQVKLMALLAGAVLGSLPMLIHGYLIIFRGSRLF
ncbi:MAG TPA: HXXEE domain-containing protein [Pyrinomonadaceae bacterium]|nr:HXXEE domain-containing protein [Pyrinomonadaceae bacterium]